MKATLIALALVLAMPGKRGSAQETPANQKPRPSQVRRSPSLFDRYFPFRVGQTRSYIVRSELAEGSGQNLKLEPILGRYTETVHSIRSIAPSTRIVEVRGIGTGTDLTVCDSDPFDRHSSAWEFWYILQDDRVFLKCTRDEVDAFTSALSGSPSGKTSEAEPEYLLPFKVGDSWGADPASPKRTDSFYEWFVEDKLTVTVPAGKYDDCYRMVFRTLPDHLERWVCSGGGLVAEEYTHHGTEGHYRTELTKVTESATKSIPSSNMKR
jgi:hypothetical protein